MGITAEQYEQLASLARRVQNTAMHEGHSARVTYTREERDDAHRAATEAYADFVIFAAGLIRHDRP